MLTMWMNAEDRYVYLSPSRWTSTLNSMYHSDLSYFDGSLQDVKDVINGSDNAVYIPTDLNCWVRALRDSVAVNLVFF